MKKIIISIVLIVIILVSIVAIVFVSIDKGLIPGIDDPGTGNPDSNPDADPEQIAIGIRFDEPNTASYDMPETTNYHSIPIKGTVYGTELDKISALCFCWHDNIDYGRIYVTLGETTAISKCTKYNDYNYVWETRMLIMRLGKGDHVLRARVLDQDLAVSAEATVVIKIPDKYIYKWDSREPDTADAYSNGGYYYGFGMPYDTYFTPDPKGWLQGDIIKVKGQVHVSTYNGNAVGLNMDLWDGYSERWSISSLKINVQGTGWFDVDVNCQNMFASWIYIAGRTSDTVDGFVGEVWVVPGTVNPTVSILNIINGWFNDINKPPHP